MAKLNTKFTITQESRPCMIDGQAAWHRFFGFQNDGYTSRAVAIIEFGDGTTRVVDAEKVKFLDNRPLKIVGESQGRLQGPSESW